MFPYTWQTEVVSIALYRFLCSRYLNNCVVFDFVNVIFICYCLFLFLIIIFFWHYNPNKEHLA